MSKQKIKLIELTDTFVDNKYEFPYIQSIKSHVRFILRTKLTYDYKPIILIQNQKSFHNLLPLES